MKKIVIALGGNALQAEGKPATAQAQLEVVEETAQYIADIIQQGYQVVVAHGNGPQVGRIVLQNEYAVPVTPAMPFDVCGAMSQGYIGYDLQNGLREELLERLLPGDVVVLCGSLPQELLAGWYRDLTAECRKKGAAVYLDTAGEPLILGITAKPDCIKPNREELEPLYGYRLATTESLAEAAWQLLHRGVGQVVVSLGAQGALLATREAVLFAAAPTVTALNTTGAGDTMTAALIYARLHGLTPEETLRFAVAAATAKVVRAGTQPPVMSDIGALQPQVEVRSI